MAAQSSSDNEPLVASELVNRIRTGDVTAEQEMVQRYSRGLNLMLRRRAGGHAISDDVAQDTWALVIQKVRGGELRDPSKLGPFIAQIGRNQLIMAQRKGDRIRPLTDTDAVDAADDQNSPHAVNLRDERRIAVRRLIDEMSVERDRHILRRFYLNEDSKEAICSDFDLEDLHFNRVLFRARKRFQELWKAYDE